MWNVGIACTVFPLFFVSTRLLKVDMNTFQCTALIYHRLSSSQVRNKYVLSVETFRQHLATISARQIKPVAADDVLDGPEKNGAVGTGCLLITFDDGNLSDFEIAFPLLAEYSFTATFFITTDLIGSDGYMTADQIALLSQSGMSVQSHAKTHKFLDEMDGEELRRELQESRDILEGIIGKPVTALSIPGGRFNDQVITCARNLGYKRIFTSYPFQYVQEQGIALIGRIGIQEPIPPAAYHKYLAPTFQTVFTLKSKQYIKKKLMQLLGGRLYYSLWEIVVKKKRIRE